MKSNGMKSNGEFEAWSSFIFCVVGSICLGFAGGRLIGLEFGLSLGIGSFCMIHSLRLHMLAIACNFIGKNSTN